MTINYVLLDLIDDSNRRVHAILDETTDDCFYWQPDPAANSIATTLWHVARAMDVFYTQHILDRPPEEEVWIQSGWMEKAGYDPRGIGTNGWGMLTGYSQEEAAAIPPMDKELLGGYYDEVMMTIQAYVESAPEENWLESAPGFEQRQTYYFWIKHPLFDLTRHLGEIYHIKAVWERTQTA